jgi:ABC-2 type transport system ATP-binding protein
MDEAERCGRVAFLHQGELLQVDQPDAMKREYGFAILETSDLKAEEREPRCVSVPGIIDMYTVGDRVHVVCEKSSVDGVRQVFRARNVRTSVIVPAFEDVFISLIRQKDEKR